jgi:hypothetical protein
MSGTKRGLRGGAWLYLDIGLASSGRNLFDYDPSVETFAIGFRVASADASAVPEPGSMIAVSCFLASGLTLRKRSSSYLGKS